jgi:hypothetical protein
MIIGYFFKTLKLVIMMINICFFLSMMWIAFCEVTMEYTLSSGTEEEQTLKSSRVVDDFFLGYSGIT